MAGRPPIYHNEVERIAARRRQWRERSERMRGKRKRTRKISGVALSYNMVVRQMEFTDPPPPDVIAERNLALYCSAQSLTAVLLGDPPPGRSALDQRGGRV